MANFAIGVDLGGTNLRIAAVDETGRLLEKVTTGTRVALGRDQVINDMTDAIRALGNKFRSSHTMLGAGIGVPGIIDMETGLLRESPNLPGWEEYPVHDEIERRLGAPVILENDANAAALGEKWLGAARDVDDMCILTLGTGVGGGLVLHGRIWHGMNGMAGEFGHMTVDTDGPRCNCGNLGCIEQFASATAVMRMAREAISSGHAPQLARVASEDPEFSAKIVYNLAIQGDEPARDIFRRVGIALGIALGDLVNALNLPMYVIGGGVASAWEAFAPYMFEELQNRSMVYAATAPTPAARQPSMGVPAFPAKDKGKGAAAEVQPRPMGRKTIVTRALLGSDAGLYGAARLPMLPHDPAWDS
jgi:glucokinase